jgi:hypothetical protein
MDDKLQEMAGRAQVANLNGLFQVVKGIALTESIPTSDSWRKAPSELLEFLALCVKDSGASSAEVFVLGADIGPLALRNPLLIPDSDRDELRKWHGFYSRAFRLRQYTDDLNSRATQEKETAELVKDVAGFIQWRLRAHGVKKPF